MQWGGPFLSCKIDVVWTLLFLGDKLPDRFDLYLCNDRRLQGTIAPLDLLSVGVFLVTGLSVIAENGIHGQIRVRS